MLYFSGSFSSYAIPANRWSWAFVPTKGKSTLVSIPSAFKTFGSPIPESSRTCGDLMALAGAETSLDGALHDTEAG